MQDKRIIFSSSCPNRFWAGCEMLWQQTAIRLSALNQVTAVINPYPYDEPKIHLLKAAEVRIINRDNRWIPARTNERMSIRFTRILKKYRPDFVVLSEGEQLENVAHALVCARMKIPYCIINHSCTPFVWPNQKRLNLARTAYTEAAHVYFVCHENRRHLEVKLSMDLPDASIVRNPYDADYDQEFDWNFENPGIEAACVGSARMERKGQDILLRVLSEQKWRERPLHVKFYLNGTPEDQKAVRDIAEYLKLENVSFSEYQRSVSDIWKHHQLLISPSRREGLPIVLVEAMMHGRVPVVTDVDGHAELVRNGINGFVAEAASLRSVDRVLEDMWDKKDSLKELALNAHQSIRENVSPDPAAEFIRHLEPVINNCS